jgi:hypothetical protein
VHAVARAVDVAAGDALVRLHQVEAAARELAAHGAREAPVAPEAADVEGSSTIAVPSWPGQLRVTTVSVAPCARSARSRLHEALGAARGIVAARARARCAARAGRRVTARGGDVRSARAVEQLVHRRMHALDLERRQALAHLAAAAAVVAARAARVVARDDAVGDAPGSPLVLAARAEERHDRRAHRGGDVHRRGVDAEEERARAPTARHLAQRELAREVGHGHRGLGEDAPTIAFSRASGAAVTTMRWPSRARRRSSSALRVSVHALKSQREVGCTG